MSRTKRIPMPPKELLDLLRYLHSHGTLLPAKFLDNSCIPCLLLKQETTPCLGIRFLSRT